jgi:predicted RNase H-like HicB family nuclease
VGELKIKLMEIQRKESFVKIKTEVMKYEEDGKIYFVGHVTEPKELSGCICQGNSEEELEKKLSDAIRFTLMFYQKESQDLGRLAIFRGNKGYTQVWFTIVGLGLTLNWTDGKYVTMRNGWKNFGITTQGGLRLGKLLIFTQNHWKKTKTKQNG